MKELPIGRQTFSDVIENDLLYVDKSEYIWNLVKEGKYYFLSRPRRFGKSILLSTLKSYFEGRKELFTNLYIGKKEKNWKKHPVIHLDYALIDYRTDAKTFNSSLLSYLQSIATSYELTIDENIVTDYFRSLILSLEKKYGKVVILVDEYDKPLVDTLTTPIRFKENRVILNNLYGNLKSLDASIRFVFLTGVSRFAKVGVFSGLNNLQDISIDPAYSEIVGFTQEELETYFAEHLAVLRKEYNVPQAELLAGIKEWYNGFTWNGTTHLYNPFSLFNLFIQKIFGNYWFDTGTPSFLIEAFINQKQLPEKLEGIVVNDLTGGSIINQSLAIYPLLFQTGYLTIEKVIREGFETYYQLNFPNREVRHAFYTYLLSAFLNKDNFEVQPEAIQLKKALASTDSKHFIQLITGLFADIPARLHMEKEAYYHSLVYIVFRLMGVNILLEKETDKGRIDGVIELADKIYILEFKFATSSRIKNVKTLTKKALQQIKDRKYYEPYLGSKKQIILFGIGFLDKQIDGKTEVWNA